MITRIAPAIIGRLKNPDLFRFLQARASTCCGNSLPCFCQKIHGIDKYEYWRLQKAQNNRCAVCGEPPGKRALHVDHCHTTNKIRGLVCHHCNIAIGMLKDDVQTARAIADYLEKHLNLSSESPYYQRLTNNRILDENNPCGNASVAV